MSSALSSASSGSSSQSQSSSSSSSSDEETTYEAIYYKIPAEHLPKKKAPPPLRPRKKTPKCEDDFDSTANCGKRYRSKMFVMGGVVSRFILGSMGVAVPSKPGTIYGGHKTAFAKEKLDREESNYDFWEPIAVQIMEFVPPPPRPSHMIFFKSIRAGKSCVFDSKQLTDMGFAEYLDFRYSVYLVFTGDITTLGMNINRHRTVSATLPIPKNAVIQMHGRQFWANRAMTNDMTFCIDKGSSKRGHEFGMMLFCSMKETRESETCTPINSPPRQRMKYSVKRIEDYMNMSLTISDDELFQSLKP